jgi:hypothetical protein
MLQANTQLIRFYLCTISCLNSSRTYSRPGHQLLLLDWQAENLPMCPLVTVFAEDVLGACIPCVGIINRLSQCTSGATLKAYPEACTDKTYS